MQNGAMRKSAVLIWFNLALVGASLLATGPASAQDTRATQISYEGTLGPTRIGLTILAKGGNTIAGGHYFYTKYFTDIPLTGSMNASALSLKGADGGTFSLMFVKPLDFSNSVGLEGTWSKDGKSLPVKLTSGGQSPVSASGRWYEMVTGQTDLAFEAKAHWFWKAALAGDRATTAKFVSFPLRVNQNGKRRTIIDAAELSAQWETIFTPAYLAKLRNDLPHDMSIVQAQAMLGDGQAFFDDKGATALNIP